MDIEDFRDFCLSLPHTIEHFPFDDKILVFKVGDKIYSLIDVEEPDSFNVKCDPEKALELRERYQTVVGGYHMNKKHWNTIYFNGELTNRQLQHWIRHSYELVYSKLTKKKKQSLSENTED